MKKFSDLPLNEGIQSINSNGGYGMVRVKKTQDGMGYSVDFGFGGTVLESDLPDDAQEQLRQACDGMEKVFKALGWIQL